MMKTPGYIPRRDAAFATWAATFSRYLQDEADALGLDAAQAAALAAQITAFKNSLLAHETAHQQAAAARQVKDAARKLTEKAIRAVVRTVQANAAVTDSQRAALGITVRDRLRTPSTAAGLGRPLGRVMNGQRLRHEIAFSDEATPTRRAKPAGVIGCEIWAAVRSAGEAAPADVGELRFLGLATASPFVAVYEGGEGGRTAHYLLRWVKTGGIQGPWSETLSATIGG